MNTGNSVLLSSGFYMPLVGLGTWQTSDEEEVARSVEAAIKAGYRHIDTAFVYKNEAFIGKVLKKLFDNGEIKREELFITTKLPPNGNDVKYVEYFCQKSLAALQLDYIDLYLIHGPFSTKKTDNDEEFMPMVDGVFQGDHTIDLVDTWKGMESLVHKGLVRSIGLSNLNSQQIQRICDNAHIQPANLQVECHVYLPQYELHKFCKEKNISFTAYAPLASPGVYEYARKNFKVEITEDKPKLLQDARLEPLAKKYNKTVSQIILRYLVQRDIMIIPKSSNEERIKSNIEIFDFSLSDEDVNTLKGMQNGYRVFDFNFFPGFKEHPGYPFHIPY